MRQWECQRDGACCTQPSSVTMTVQEWAELAPLTPQRPVALERSPVDGFVVLKAAPCPFYSFSERGCTVYEKRPYNCRRFMCLRWEPAREAFDVAPMHLMRGNNDLRWSYQRNQRLHQPWALAHGWKP